MPRMASFSWHARPLGCPERRIMEEHTNHHLKRCSSCRQEKPLGQFYRNKSTLDGLNYSCMPCALQSVKDSQKRHRVSTAVRRRAFYQKEKNKLRRKSRRYGKRFPAKIKAHNDLYRQTHKVEKASHNLVNNAIRAGRLNRRPCEICGSVELIHAHHEDYNEPLVIRWLCASHHKQLHSGHFILLAKVS